jgi:exopolysaccharide production protein ExoZ
MHFASSIAIDGLLICANVAALGSGGGVKLRSVQALRAVAATLVVARHCGHWWLGSFGVDLFFVISGFIIATIAPGKRPIPFLVDRVWRIYPTYWLYLPLLFLLLLMAGGVTWQQTVSTITLWPVYGEFIQPYHRQAWSLCFEMLFYLGVAATLWLGSVRPLLVGYVVALAAYAVTRHPLALFIGNPIIAEFLAGVAIARIPKRATLAPYLLVAAVVILALSPAFWLNDAPIVQLDGREFVRPLWWGIPAFLIVYSALCLEHLFKRWADALVSLGDASYSVYLSHGLLIAFFHIGGMWRTGPIIFAGWLLSKLTEQPLIRYRISSRARSSPSPRFGCSGRSTSPRRSSPEASNL